jgi:hypothetical protein
MSDAEEKPSLNPREIAEISRLADGTLADERRAEVEARIAASGELAEAYAHERRAVELLRSARERDRAPAGLRARIEAERPSARTRARRRVTYGGALAGALAAVALALALILPAGTPGSPSVSQAAGLALLGPQHPAPAPDPLYPRAKLGIDIENIYFPNWSTRFGWRAVGQRTDTIKGRTATTVFYADDDGDRIAYTIVGAPVLSEPAAQVTTLNGTELRTLEMNGRLVVTWRRSGHTCVLSGTGVSPAVMQKLAAWRIPAGVR